MINIDINNELRGILKLLEDLKELLPNNDKLGEAIKRLSSLIYSGSSSKEYKYRLGDIRFVISLSTDNHSLAYRMLKNAEIANVVKKINTVVSKDNLVGQTVQINIEKSIKQKKNRTYGNRRNPRGIK